MPRRLVSGFAVFIRRAAAGVHYDPIRYFRIQTIPMIDAIEPRIASKVKNQ